MSRRCAAAVRMVVSFGILLPKRSIYEMKDDINNFKMGRSQFLIHTLIITLLKHSSCTDILYIPATCSKGLLQLIRVPCAYCPHALLGKYKKVVGFPGFLAFL